MMLDKHLAIDPPGIDRSQIKSVSCGGERQPNKLIRRFTKITIDDGTTHRFAAYEQVDGSLTDWQRA